MKSKLLLSTLLVLVASTATADTVVMAESDVVLVCASAPQGPVFYPLSSVSAAQVMKAVKL